MSSPRLPHARRFDNRCIGALTQREREIAELVTLGETNRRIWSELKITHFTFHSHLKRIYAKTGVENRVQLAVAITREKLKEHNDNQR